jgi:hypothetical protein
MRISKKEQPMDELPIGFIGCGECDTCVIRIQVIRGEIDQFDAFIQLLEFMDLLTAFMVLKMDAEMTNPENKNLNDCPPPPPLYPVSLN